MSHRRNIDQLVNEELWQLLLQHRHDHIVSRDDNALHLFVLNGPTQRVDHFLDVMQMNVLDMTLISRL